MKSILSFLNNAVRIALRIEVRINNIDNDEDLQLMRSEHLSSQLIDLRHDLQALQEQTAGATEHLRHQDMQYQTLGAFIAGMEWRLKKLEDGVAMPRARL